MNFSIFSAVMAVGCSSVIILMIHLLRKRPLFLKRFGVVTVLFLYAVCVFRILFVFEFPFTRSIAWREGLNDFYQAVYFDKVQIAGSFEYSLWAKADSTRQQLEVTAQTPVFVFVLIPTALVLLVFVLSLLLVNRNLKTEPIYLLSGKME